MATLTIRRLDEDDHEWLRRVARQEGVSVEEYVRRLVRTAKVAASRTLGEVLEEMNASLDAEGRALLAEPPPIERLPLRARDLFPPDDGETSARAAS